MKKIKRIITVIINTIILLLYKIKRNFVSYKYPNNSNNEVLIHLGCGEINSPEFINVDARFFPHIHHVGEVQLLPFFKNDFADMLYTSHTLEHIPMKELNSTLSEWYRVLKPGGILRISVPDFDKIISIYNDNDKSIKSIWMPLLGGQEYKENSHYAVFNENYLTTLLLEIGFKDICVWDPLAVKHHDFTDWASILLEINKKEYPISLNLEAVK